MPNKSHTRKLNSFRKKALRADRVEAENRELKEKLETIGEHFDLDLIYSTQRRPLFSLGPIRVSIMRKEAK